MISDTITYHCNNCNESYSPEQFYERNGKIVYPCKKCKQEYYKQWKASHQRYHASWHEKNPGKNKMYNDKYRNKLRTINGGDTSDDTEQG